jgi:hypothetical protein
MSQNATSRAGSPGCIELLAKSIGQPSQRPSCSS